MPSESAVTKNVRRQGYYMHWIQVYRSKSTTIKCAVSFSVILNITNNSFSLVSENDLMTLSTNSQSKETHSDEGKEELSECHCEVNDDGNE